MVFRIAIVGAIAALLFSAGTLDLVRGRGRTPSPYRAEVIHGVMDACLEAGTDRRVCSCVAHHVASDERDPAPHVESYAESCTRWARILGLVDHG